MTTTHTVIDSPLGPLMLRADDGVLSGLWMSEHRHRPDGDTSPPPAAALAPFGDERPDGLPAVREQLAAYFAGDLTVFDVPLAVRGTEFQRRVWAALREIPYGATRSYGELAAAIGQPSAVRAVGLANGRNPVSIVVPCHRVVGANGSLTGYGGGIERKRALLALESGHAGGVAATGVG